MSRRILVFGLILCLLLAGTACGRRAEPAPQVPTPGTAAPATQETAAPDITGSPSPSPTPQPSPTAVVPLYNGSGKRIYDNRDPEDTREAFRYAFNPHVLSDLMVRAYGEKVKEAFFGFCDAVLAGEETFPCESEEIQDAVFDLARTYLPVGVLIRGRSMEKDASGQGICRLDYGCSKEEWLEKADAFRTRITELIRSADLRDGDTDLEKALKLYTASSLRILYDYDALSGELLDLSPYRVLMGDLGICQEIAGAYAYLLLQAGMEACTCGTLTKDNNDAHEWTMVFLGGEYCFADVTWQVDEPYGLRWFGENDEQRDADGMDIQYNNIGGSNILWHRDVPVTGEAFRPLQDAVWYRIDHAAGEILYYAGEDIEKGADPDAKGKLLRFPFPD